MSSIVLRDLVHIDKMGWPMISLCMYRVGLV